MKTLAVRMLIVLAVPMGLAMAQTAKEGTKGPGGEEKSATKYSSICKLFAARLGFNSEQSEKFLVMYEKHLELMRAENERFEAEVNGMLTPEQQAKFKEMTANRERKMKGMGGGAKKGSGIDQAVQQLNLPAEKLAQVQTILKEGREKMEAVPRGDFKSRMQIHKGMMEKIKGVLSQDEMAALEKCMKESRPNRAASGKGK